MQSIFCKYGILKIFQSVSGRVKSGKGSFSLNGPGGDVVHANAMSTPFNSKRPRKNEVAHSDFSADANSYFVKVSTPDFAQALGTTKADPS